MHLRQVPRALDLAQDLFRDQRGGLVALASDQRGEKRCWQQAMQTGHGILSVAVWNRGRVRSLGQEREETDIRGALPHLDHR